jgi:hypothetical protein
MCFDGVYELFKRNNPRSNYNICDSICLNNDENESEGLLYDGSLNDSYSLNDFFYGDMNRVNDIARAQSNNQKKNILAQDPLS